MIRISLENNSKVHKAKQKGFDLLCESEDWILREGLPFPVPYPNFAVGRQALDKCITQILDNL